MRHRDLYFTPHITSILITSLSLFALSVALIALEAKVQDAFSTQQLQYPGSSLAEFMFVSLNPPNIEMGPTVIKFAAGSCGLAVSLLGTAWTVAHWCRAGGRANIVHVRTSV